MDASEINDDTVEDLMRATEGSARRTLRDQLHELSLEQALRDFEVANARVVDLTQRLLEANQTIARLGADLDQLRREYDELNDTHSRMQHSQAFRIASRIWNVRNAVRR